MVGTRDGRQFWVDVKGLSTKSDWLLKPKPAHLNLYYVLVFLSPLAGPDSRREADQFYVLTQNEANRLEEKYRQDRPGRKHTMSGFLFSAPRDFRDKWEKLPRVNADS
jgi:hypothetical protein